MKTVYVLEEHYKSVYPKTLYRRTWGQWYEIATQTKDWGWTSGEGSELMETAELEKSLINGSCRDSSWIFRQISKEEAHLILYGSMAIY